MYFWMGLPKYVFNKNADFALEHWHCSMARLIADTSAERRPVGWHGSGEQRGPGPQEDSSAWQVTARPWWSPLYLFSCICPPDWRFHSSTEHSSEGPCCPAFLESHCRHCGGFCAFQGKNLLYSLFPTVSTHQYPQQALPRNWKALKVSSS